MGYTTEFEGHVTIEPPLNAVEIEYLRRFAGSRRMHRKAGPYFAEDDGNYGQSDRGGVIDFNRPGDGQPGLWCQWVPADDGAALQWDGGEKFYDSEEWMQYLIDHFLRPHGRASVSMDPQFVGFTFDHVVNGTIDASGESRDDRWQLVVQSNTVSRREGHVVFADQVEERPAPIRVDATIGKPVPEIEG